MQRALKAAAKCLDSGGGSLDAVKSAICALEVRLQQRNIPYLRVCTSGDLTHCVYVQDAAVTNAGTGSNLTMSGGVECDASIMSGSGTQAAVGAVPGKHADLAAKQLPAVRRCWRHSCSTAAGSTGGPSGFKTGCTTVTPAWLHIKV